MQTDKIKEFLEESNYPLYRLRQVLQNYYSGRYLDFNGMTNLPADLRKILDSKFKLLSVVSDKSLKSGKTNKIRFKLNDQNLIESVLMDYGGWITACVSSQVGCPLNCAFCATGKMGFKRNLSFEEIVDQIIYWNHEIFPRYVGRVVFMGMGEPFLNWDNFLTAVKILNDKNGLNIGIRKMSVSTAGIAPKIKELADLKSQINLAVSLHSVDNQVRWQIMPITSTYPLSALESSCQYYVAKTNRQLFFEYSPISGINDSPTDIKKLISFIKSHPLFFLNLIPLNFSSNKLKPSSKETFDRIQKAMLNSHTPFSVRQSFGQEIMSACGQLSSGHQP